MTGLDFPLLRCSNKCWFLYLLGFVVVSKMIQSITENPVLSFFKTKRFCCKASSYVLLRSFWQMSQWCYVTVSRRRNTEKLKHLLQSPFIVTLKKQAGRNVNIDFLDFFAVLSFLFVYYDWILYRAPLRTEKRSIQYDVTGCFCNFEVTK